MSAQPGRDQKEQPPIGQKARVAGVLSGNQNNPFVPAEKSKSSYLGVFAAFVIVVGNALNAAGQAFFNISNVSAKPFAVISAAGTFGAMLKLYGDSVFPALQKMITSEAQQDEYMALIGDLHKAKDLGLGNDTAKLQLFLTQCFEERCDMLRRKTFRKILARKADDLRVDLHDDFDVDVELVGPAMQKIQGTQADFLRLLKNYFNKNAKKESMEFKDEISSFFDAIYRQENAELKEGSLFKVEVETLKSLLEAKKAEKFGLDLEAAFTQVSIYQQWLWTKQRRNQLIDGKEWARRIAKLKKALQFTNPNEFTLFIQGLDASVTAVGAAASANNGQVAENLFSGEKEESLQHRQDFTRYRNEMAERAYNVSFRIFRERLATGLGHIIGFFGAIGNAALGYVGLMALIGLMGLGATPAAWVPLLILGMITGFGSSFFMTRLSIVERLKDLGRYFDKDLPVKNKRSRYFSVLFGLLGAAGPAYFAFLSGQALVAGLLGVTPGLLAVGFIFAMVCGVATFFGAGALMVEYMYKNMEPYVLIAEEPNKTKTERFKKMLRLLFLGQRGDNPEKLSREQLLRIFFSKSLGLALLIGAIGSQVTIGAAPLILTMLIFSVIAMFPLYSGVFDVAKQLVDAIFKSVLWTAKGLVWMYHNPIPVFAALGAALGLELLAVATTALISKAAVLGVTASMAAPILVTGLVVFFIAASVMVYMYNAVQAAKKNETGGSLPQVPKAGPQAAPSGQLGAPKVTRKAQSWCWKGCWKAAAPGVGQVGIRLITRV